MPTHRIDPKIELVRRSFPVTSAYRYLNTASMGPVSAICSRPLQRWIEEDMRRGRAHPERFERLATERGRLRSEIAALVAARPADIVLTQGTGHGLETVLESFDWRDGDEVVTTSLEHAACADPLRRVAERRGLSLEVAEPPPEPGDDLDWLSKAVSPRTRLIAVSAVAYESGYRLPLQRIARLAAAASARTLVDAAQCAGAVPLDLPALGVDFCAMPLQKWLCGPEGLGALYVRDEAAPALVDAPRDRVVQGPGLLEAATAQMRWQRETVGWEWIWSRTATLTAHARTLLSALPGVRLLTPTSHAGLTTLAPAAADARHVHTELSKRRFAVRCLPELNALRISTAYFNTESEIDDLAATLSALL